MSAKRLSGLQKDVISLYREILREAYKKEKELAPTHITSSSTSTSRQLSPLPQNSFTYLLSAPESTVSYARSEFRREAHSIQRSDFRTIEYSLRKGKKHIQLLKMPGVKVFSGSSRS